jgi:cellulose synthase/poly-beta-1,6-N-acetylglucosamine synthase-like glycosyltransferase
MIEYILWGISFISLWISLIWLNMLVFEPSQRRTLPKNLPMVTVGIPVFNREKVIAKTVKSLNALNYPKNLIQVIIVDDCSTDNSYAEAKRLQKEYSGIKIDVFRHSKNRGKSAAVNTAISHAKGALFTCLDGDTRVHPDSLRHLVPHFADPKLGAVIGQVKVDEPKNIYEKLQRVEYIISNFIRRMMSSLGTLAIAPGGALSMFNLAILKKVGGFAEAGMTEDLEIALRLRSNGYHVQMDPRAIMYTKVPEGWNDLFRQRVRWYRGFAVNHMKYKGLLFKKAYGLYGLFQMPLNVLSIFLLLLTVAIVGYGTLGDFYETLYRSLTIKGYFFNHLLDFPGFKKFLLSMNVQVAIPIILGVILGLYLTYLAHKEFNERFFKHAHHIALYTFIAPYVTTVHWVSAIVKEALGTKKKW